MSALHHAGRSAHCARVATALTVAFVLSACVTGSASAQSNEDSALAARVSAAIENASDLPTNAFVVAASAGVVRITGSVVCEDCGGMKTPGGMQSIQQSLGAIVRAVPGVERVEFDLEYRP